MTDGFLGFPTTFMLDVVVCALVLIVPLLAYSIYLVKGPGNYRRHKNLQIVLAGLLLVTVFAFEFDVQWMHGGWEKIVARRQPTLSAEQLAFVRNLLLVHLVFALSTPVLWTVTLVLALKRYPNPPMPGRHSPLHKKLGWLSTVDLTLTSVTGLLWYYYAFVA